MDATRNSFDPATPAAAASAAELDRLRTILAEADEKLQMAIAAARREQPSVDRTMTLAALDRARAALGCMVARQTT